MMRLLNPNVRKVLVVIGVWIAVGALFAAQASIRTHVPFGRMLVYSLASWFPVVMFVPLIARVAQRYRFSEGARARSAVAHLLTLISFMVIGATLMGAFEWFLPFEPSRLTLKDAMLRAIPGYMSINVLTYVLLVSTFQALAYSREVRERSVVASELRSQLAEARMHALTAHVQPHFLFNTLNGISALIRENPRRAEQLIARLSDLLRSTLDETGPNEVTLAQELDLLAKYLDIQQARFGDRMIVDVIPDEHTTQLRVPRFILQPIVENAIRHGIAPRPGTGMIRITSQLADGELHLVVEDDGTGLPASPRGIDGLGLSITRARLQQFGGGKGILTLEPGSTGGTRCTLVLPARRTNGAAGPLSAGLTR